MDRRLALDRRYDGPVEGIMAIFTIAVDYGAVMIDTPLIVLLVAGGIVIGLLGELVARRWG